MEKALFIGLMQRFCNMIDIHRVRIHHCSDVIWFSRRTQMMHTCDIYLFVNTLFVYEENHRHHYLTVVFYIHIGSQSDI